MIGLFLFLTPAAQAISALCRDHISFPDLLASPPGGLPLDQNGLPVRIPHLLGREFGFHEVVTTDALNMRGLTRLYPDASNSSGRIGVDAVKAGDDVLMVPGDIGAAYNAILSAVKSGEETPEARIDELVRRILEMKAALGLNESKYVDVDKIRSLFSENGANEFAQQVSDEAVTLVGNKGDVVPLVQSESGEAAMATLLHQNWW